MDPDGRLAKRSASAEDEGNTLRAVVEYGAELVLLLDADAGVLYASPAVSRATGHACNEILGRSLLEFVIDDDRSAVEASLRRVVRGSSAVAVADVSCRIVTRDDRVLWLEGTARNLLGDPNVSGLLVHFRDVTDRVVLEDELLHADKLQSIGRLASAVAHDFNNLLTCVLGAAELAMLRQEQPAAVRACLEQITQYSHHATDLTRQLLGFARKQAVAPKPVDLNALVLQTESLLDRLIGDRVVIETSLDPSLGMVEIDPNRMQQVLLNLAINARDAMPSGGTLRLSTENAKTASGDSVVLSVSDNGVGMTEETLSRVFEPFFTTKGIGAGTGLGLATCRAIIGQARGRIDVQSRLHEGTTFVVQLPRASGGPASEVVRREMPRYLRGSETVLVVDDDDGVRWSMAELLRHLGYVVLTARSGLEALAVSERHEGDIHAVLVDVWMPQLDGPSLVKRLSAKRPGITTLYVTGDGSVASCMPNDAVVLEKPVELEGLAVALRELLEDVRHVRATGT